MLIVYGLIIAHISDLNLGPQFVPESFKLAWQEIRKLGPDVVVASGDFTENGLSIEKGYGSHK